MKKAVLTPQQIKHLSLYVSGRALCGDSIETAIADWCAMESKMPSGAPVCSFERSYIRQDSREFYSAPSAHNRNS